MTAEERKKRVMESLEKVGLKERVHHMPNQLSGGQQQRVSIARALATHPSSILADEPTGALDSKTGHEVLEFLKQLNNEGNTIVLITHDLGIAAEAKRIIRIQDLLQFVIEAGTTSALGGVLGIIFGYFPAAKASKLNPIDALRHD